MNRIRFWREKRGLSQAALAERIGMTQANLSRLEKGDHKLTVELMLKLSHALDVEPVDLLPLAIVAGLANDVACDEIEAPHHVAAVLRQRQMRSFKVCTNAVESRGIKRGDSVVVDARPEAVDAIRDRDLVIAEVRDRGKPNGPSFLVLREFVAPALLTTNRPGQNHIFRLDDDSLDVRIIGVVILPTE